MSNCAIILLFVCDLSIRPRCKVSRISSSLKGKVCLQIGSCLVDDKKDSCKIFQYFFLHIPIVILKVMGDNIDPTRRMRWEGRGREHSPSSLYFSNQRKLNFLKKLSSWRWLGLNTRDCWFTLMISSHSFETGEIPGRHPPYWPSPVQLSGSESWD